MALTGHRHLEACEAMISNNHTTEGEMEKQLIKLIKNGLRHVCDKLELHSGMALGLTPFGQKPSSKMRPISRSDYICC